MSEAGKEANKVYTISMSTVIKMECDNCSKSEHIEKGTKHKFSSLYSVAHAHCGTDVKSGMSQLCKTE